LGAGSSPLLPQPLSAEDLAISERVHTGRIPCELGAFVNVTADQANPGYFNIDGKGFKYHMSPVKTSTGTVRLEDKHAGAVWLQIANKSMLMNQKVGQRLADECMSPDQLQVAEAIKKNPPPSPLKAPKPAGQKSRTGPERPASSPTLENHGERIMLKAYRDHVAERAALGIPPLPLEAKQVAELIELIKNPPAG